MGKRVKTRAIDRLFPSCRVLVPTWLLLSLRECVQKGHDNKGYVFKNTKR